MRFTLTIDMDNAAFDEDGDELAEILTGLARRTAALPTWRAGGVQDSNGNTVGHWEITDE